ncbi:endonuclease/exonuclease/phosphatase family protein [Streptomyces sp. NPDC004227]
MPVAPRPDHTLTVASWNLHEGVPASGGTDPCSAGVAEEVVRFLTHQRVDIVAFQEVGFDDRGTSELLDHITRRTALRHTAALPLHESSFFPGRLSGVAVAGRFPLSRYRQHWLPNPGLRTTIEGQEIHSHDKGLVTATFPLGGTEVDVTSLHVLPFYLFRRDPDEAEFKEVWDSLAGALGRHANSRLTLVCGDFNTPERRLVLGAGTLPLASSIDGRPTYKDRSVDDILYGPGIAVNRTEVVDNFSDHRACIAQFRLPTGPGR